MNAIDPLPVAIDRLPLEAFDSYLERVADANDLTSATTHRLAPVNSGTPTQVRHRAARDPGDRAGRRLGRDGWAPGAIVQACPDCLATDGAWLRHWYDPMTTCCLRHGVYLVTDCPGCGQPLRSSSHLTLRPVGAGTQCTNPLAPGRGPRCDIDLAGITPTPAPAEVLEQQARQQQSATLDTVIFGDPVSRAAYRRSLKNLTVLLLHIAARNAGAPTTFGLRSDELAATARWYLRPPHSVMVRAAVLTTANRILAEPGLDEAATVFGPWFDAIPPSWDGRVSWAADHTTADPTITRLLLVAGTPRRRLSHRMPHETGLQLRREWIPQHLPADLDNILAGCGLSTATSRAFATLCLAKVQTTTSGSWGNAAQLIGLPAEHGTALARTASTHLAITLDDWIGRLRGVAQHLRRDPINYRHRENHVRAMTGTTAAHVVLAALQDARPGTRDSSLDLVVHWAWDQWACADPTLSPVDVHRGRRSRARYAQFRDSLRQPHRRALLTAIDARTDLP